MNLAVENIDWAFAIMAVVAIKLQPYWSSHHRYWAGLVMFVVILLCWFPILQYPLPVYFAGAFSRLSWTSVLLLLVIWMRPFFKLNRRQKQISQAPYTPLSRFGLFFFVMVIAAVELSAVIPPPYTISATTGQTDAFMSFLHQIWLPDLYRWGYFQHVAPNPPLINGNMILIISWGIAGLLFLQRKSLAWILWTVLLLFSVMRYFSMEGEAWAQGIPVNIWDVLIDPILGIALFRHWWKINQS